MITVGYDALTNLIFKPFRSTIAHVDPNIAGKLLGEINAQEFSWHWPGDEASIHARVTSIVDMTI
jgi:hypothetical protein